MADFLRTKETWNYTTDTGQEYAFNALTGYTTQVAVLGGSAPSAGAVSHPKGFKPRVALVQTAAGKRRRVVCYSKDATAYTTLGTTVNIDVQGIATAAKVYATIGERHGFLGQVIPPEFP
jgi:hypothetical protein